MYLKVKVVVKPVGQAHYKFQRRGTPEDVRCNASRLRAGLDETTAVLSRPPLFMIAESDGVKLWHAYALVLRRSARPL